MKKSKLPNPVFYLVSYVLYAALDLWLFPLVQNSVLNWVKTTYVIAPAVITNVLLWLVLAFLILFRTHRNVQPDRGGTILSAILALVSIGLTAAAALYDTGLTGMILLTAEQLYDLASLLRARKNSPVA